MDAHISVVADFKTANPDIEVVDWSISKHTWVMKREEDRPEYINSSTWQSLNLGMIEKFQDRYDSFLRTFDGFIVAFSSSFAMIYEKYNKPILMINAVHYDIPFCWSKDMQMLGYWHACIERLNRKGLLTIVSNNLAHQKYTELACRIKPEYIPSLCLYTNTTYTPTKQTFLLFSGSLPTHPLVTTKKELPPGYEWNDITSFKGIVHFPYDVSLMSIFEHFTAGCPLFFPSKEYFKAHPDIQSISAYWGDQMPRYLSYFKSTDNWIELADMYTAFQSPNTYYFDSIPHLFELLETFEYIDNKDWIQSYIADVKGKWKQVIEKIRNNEYVNRSSSNGNNWTRRFLPLRVSP